MASPKLPPKTIAFTYGTFDQFDDADREKLRDARKGCDRLIVAIASDRIARSNQSEAVRSHNLTTSGLVDLVIAVDDLDQLAEAIKYYNPDVVVGPLFGEKITARKERLQ